MSVAVSERVTSYPPADLDRRFYSYAVDRLATWPLVAAGVYAAYRLFLADGDLMPGIALIVGVLAVVGMVLAAVLGTRGSSPGKAALGLRLVSADEGRPIGVGTALLRTLIVGVAGLPTFGLGLASLAWTAAMDRGRQRRGWHDHVSGSIVVDIRPVAELSARGRRGAASGRQPHRDAARSGTAAESTPRVHRPRRRAGSRRRAPPAGPPTVARARGRPHRGPRQRPPTGADRDVAGDV